jgi:SpoVK/Ycf46/Vps4 family AAA+-type ATPase
MNDEYLLDVTKILEGAIQGDREKVVAYARQIADRLENQGQTEGANWLREIIGRAKVKKLGIAKASPTHVPKSVPRDSESHLPTADEEIYERGTVPLFLPQDVEKVINKFLTFVRAADRLAANGVNVSPSMLCFGPPGCGKTQLARFIASELDLPLITARTDGLISSYLGSTAKNLRLLFEHAMARPCVLFLDEFDALAKMRDDRRELGELKRVVISLLQNIDAMGKDHVLLAATNHEHLLDPAIWRRFAYSLKLAEPGAEIRSRILRQFFGNFADDDLVKVVSAVSDGLTGAQLKHIAEDCIRDAVIGDQRKVLLRDAVAAALAVNPKLAPKSSSLHERLRTLRSLNQKEFTQVRLAQIFGVSQAHVSKLLKNGA